MNPVSRGCSQVAAEVCTQLLLLLPQCCLCQSAAAGFTLVVSLQRVQVGGLLTSRIERVLQETEPIAIAPGTRSLSFLPICFQEATSRCGYTGALMPGGCACPALSRRERRCYRREEGRDEEPRPSSAKGQALRTAATQQCCRPWHDDRNNPPSLPHLKLRRCRDILSA